MAQVNLGRVVGYSAYEIAVQNGFVGTEAEWLASLQGEDGATGPQGPQGPAGPAGTTSWSGINDKPFSTIGTGLEVVNGALNATGSGGMDADDVRELIANDFGMENIANEIVSLEGVESGTTYNYEDGVEVGSWDHYSTPAAFSERFPYLWVEYNSALDGLLQFKLEPIGSGGNGITYEGGVINAPSGFVCKLNVEWDNSIPRIVYVGVGMDAETPLTFEFGSDDMLYEAEVSPLADEFAPQGVIDDIDNIYDSLDRIDGDIADIRQVPTYSGASNGDVLTIDDGVPIWSAPNSELPSYDSTTIGKVLGVQQQDLRSPGIVAEVAWVDIPHEIPSYSGASEGDVLTVDNRGELSWTAPSTPSELEYESTHSSGEDYVVTKVNGEDCVEVREKVYDNGDYINGNYSYMVAGEIGSSDDVGTTNIFITPMGIGFTALDSNDAQVDGELSMSTDGELQWNGSSIIPTYTSSDAGNVLSVNSLGDGVEWAPASGGGSATSFIILDPSPNATTRAYLEALWQDVGYLASNPAVFWNGTYNIEMQLCEVNTDANRLMFYGTYARINPSTYAREATPYSTSVSFTNNGTLSSISHDSMSAVKAGVAISVSNNSVSVDTTEVAFKSELLPQCPTTTDGTYVLKATVSSGAVTYSWVAEN